MESRRCWWSQGLKNADARGAEVNPHSHSALPSRCRCGKGEPSHGEPSHGADVDGVMSIGNLGGIWPSGSRCVGRMYACDFQAYALAMTRRRMRVHAEPQPIGWSHSARAARELLEGAHCWPTLTAHGRIPASFHARITCDPSLILTPLAYGSTLRSPLMPATARDRMGTRACAAADASCAAECLAQPFSASASASASASGDRFTAVAGAAFAMAHEARTRASGRLRFART